jgi:hypothetical protein
MRLLCSLLICLKIPRMHYSTGQREYVCWLNLSTCLPLLLLIFAGQLTMIYQEIYIYEVKGYGYVEVVAIV